jgi:hypothetical protein
MRTIATAIVTIGTINLAQASYQPVEFFNPLEQSVVETHMLQAEQINMDWFTKLFAKFGIRAEDIALFSLGFLIGGVPLIAAYSSNECVADLAPALTYTWDIIILTDWIEKRKAAKKKVSWRKWLILGTYAAKLAIQLPIAEESCRYIWPYIGDLFDAANTESPFALMSEEEQMGLRTPKLKYDLNDLSDNWASVI